MKIIWLLIHLFIWCQAAETLDQLTDLGQNVTINCDLDEGDIYWLLLKVPDPPVMILGTLPKTSLFFNTTFKRKYSVQSKNHLFINNITVNELGVYYCMKTDTPPKFSSGIRLQIKDSSDTEIVVHYIHQNHTVVKFIEQSQTHWMIIILISALLNGVLVIVVIAGGCFHCAKTKTPKDVRSQQTQPVEQPEETKSYSLYTAVSFSLL